MFDLLGGPHTTLLGFGAHWQSVIEACVAKFAGSVQGYVILSNSDTHSADSEAYSDMEGHARTAYGDGTLFVVRPDNYIGLATLDPTPGPVLEYLRAISPSSAVATSPIAGSV